MRPKRVLPALAALLLLLTGCGSRPAWRAERLGGMAYSVKTLSGMFYTYEDELYLLSGTETPEGASSQVFVYNVDRDELAMSRHLEDGRSMTAFCEGAEEVYFSAIGSGNVYAWSKSGGEPRLLARLEGTNIYALAWDGADALYAAYGASSGAPAALYRIALPGGQAEIISSGFTEEKYVRSMSYVNGACYLGIGTKAALVKVDAASGEWRSVGEWPDEAFVYDQAVYGDKILFVLSPSCRILEYDARTGAVSDTGVLHQETNAPPPRTLSPLPSFPGRNAL